jgi:hypothetical protein
MALNDAAGRSIFGNDQASYDGLWRWPGELLR